MFEGVNERGSVRKISALVIAAGLAASLSACATGTEASSSCDTLYPSGDSSSLVSATGAQGVLPTVDFPTPLVTDGTQSTTTVTGTGAVIADNWVADYTMSVFDAKTGATLISPEGIYRAPVSAEGNPFSEAVKCQTVGSRLAITGTYGDFFGGAPDGSTVDDTAVIILDITDGFYGKADGVDQPAEPGLPSVVTAPNGNPGITVPHAKAPKTLVSDVLKQGDGATVAEGDTVTLNYLGVVWDDANPTVFAQTWDNIPTTVEAKEFDATDGSGLLPGLTDAVIGAKVGSQVIVVVPSEQSFQDPTVQATAEDTAPTGATRIYVVDILKTEK